MLENLEPIVQSNSPSLLDDTVLYLNVGNAQAQAVITTEGFVLMAGATVNEKTTEKSLSPGMLKLRTRVLEDGKVENWRTMEDILFSSSSAAANFVLGYRVSGPATWKDKLGKSLKEIESENDTTSHSLSKEQMNIELEKGYADMEKGRIKSASKTFADIRNDYKL